jgi:hypothetical protein
VRPLLTVRTVGPEIRRRAAAIVNGVILNSVFQVRPEIGYYRNWNTPSFDNGAHQGQMLYGLDMTLRF